MLFASLSKNGVFCALFLFVSLFLVPVDLAAQVNPVPVTTVSAASYERTPVAPDSLVSAFGTKLATATATATDADPNTPGIQLPTTLAGTTVRVNGRLAELLFVSPTQINFVMPGGASTRSLASVEVISGDGTMSLGNVWVTPAAPSIFTANADGKGVLAAEVVRVKSDGTQAVESLSQLDPKTGRAIMKPFSLGPESERVFLQIYLTGIRYATDANNDGNVNESVQVLFGGILLPAPSYAGKQPSFVGLDQINVEIPRTLNFLYHSGNTLNLAIHVLSRSNQYQAMTSNVVEFAVEKEQSGSPPPVIKSFSPAVISIGDTMTIIGEKFSPDFRENRVYISGYRAEIISASATQLQVIVPAGVETGKLRVFTLGGGVTDSTSDVAIRTSITGLVEEISKPMRGVKVNILGTNLSTETNSEGAFFFKDAPTGKVELEFDPVGLMLSHQYPKIKYGLQVIAGRDNQLPSPIVLPQISGVVAEVGKGASNLSDKLRLQDSGVSLILPPETIVTKEDRTPVNSITLTYISPEYAPTDVAIDNNSSGLFLMAQITPYGAKINGEAKLNFRDPRDYGYPFAGLSLYRLDQTPGSPTLGRFIEVGKASPSVENSGYEATITETGCYAAILDWAGNNFGAAIGNIVDVTSSGNLEGIKGAIFRSSSFSAFTDGFGSFITRKGMGQVIEARYLRWRKQGLKVERFYDINRSGNVYPGLRQIYPNVSFQVSDQRPVVLAPQKIEMLAGETREFDLMIYDPEAAPIRSVKFSYGENTSIASITPGTNGQYKLKIVAPSYIAGNYQWQIVAETDVQPGGTANTSIGAANIALTISANPTAPSLVVPASQTIPSGQPFTFNAVVTDPDPGQEVGVSIAGAAFGMSFFAPIRLSTTTGAFSWTPNHNQLGDYTLTFTARDSGFPQKSTVKQVKIKVVQGNRVPGLTAPSDAYSVIGYPLKINVSATDVDTNQSLLLTATGLPSGATLKQTSNVSPVSGVIEWTPTSTEPATYSITLTVTDDGSPQLSDRKIVKLSVGDPQKQWVYVQAPFFKANFDNLWLDGNKLWASYDGVYVSTDGGGNWSKKAGPDAFGLPPNTIIGPILKIEDTLLVNFNWYSTDEGVTWANPNRRFDFARSSYVVTAKSIIVGATDGIYYSQNKGATWKKSLGLPTAAFFPMLKVGTEIYASTRNNLYVSKDDGVTWDMVAPIPERSNSDIYSMAEKTGKFYLGGYQGAVYVSPDKGLTWTSIKSNMDSLGFPNPFVYAVSIHDGNLYAATSGGVYRYNESSGQWSTFNDGILLESYASRDYPYRNAYQILSVGGNLIVRTGTGIYFRKMP